MRKAKAGAEQERAQAPVEGEHVAGVSRPRGTAPARHATPLGVSRPIPIRSQHKCRGTQANPRSLNSDICKIIFAVLFPPLGVFLEVGCGGQLCLNIVFTLCGMFNSVPLSETGLGGPAGTRIASSLPGHPCNGSRSECMTTGADNGSPDRLHPWYHPRPLHHLHSLEGPSHR